MMALPFGDHSPQIDESAWVAPTASVIGQVALHANAVVMFGAVLRADRAEIVLGEGSNLQDNVVVHGDPGFPTLVGRDVSVGHGAILHGCTVEDRSLIGMGARVLNGAVIGEGSLIAAGSVVLEGEVIPPRSLVAGVPGRVRRSVTEEELQHIIDNAATYRSLAQSYRTEGH